MSENPSENRPESPKSDWLTDRLPYLRALKAPSEHQRLLLLLAGKAEPFHQRGPEAGGAGSRGAGRRALAQGTR